MSSALRLSIIMVLLLAATALGLIAYNASGPKPSIVETAQSAPEPVAATTGYFVAAHSLPAGTFVRDEDFQVRAAAPAAVPPGAIAESPEARIELRGSLVRQFIDAGHAITAQDVLRPRDRGFLASVLAPDTRAISINVDADSGVSGLIWPGDYVDVILTQVDDKADPAHRSLSEILLNNVRVIAIDQEIVEGATAANAAAGKVTHSVSLQLSAQQVKKITLAKDLGKLSLAVRSAVGPYGTVDLSTTFGCDVSPEIARQTAIARQTTTVEIYENGKVKQYSVKRQDADHAAPASACDGYNDFIRKSALTASRSEEGQN